MKDIFFFNGYCENNKLRNLLTKYDVGVMCSKSEGFGLVTVEYMLAGLCVIASNTGANLELISCGETGFLYPLGNIEKLKSIILHIYNNRENAKIIAKNAHKNAELMYTMKKSALDLIKMYHEVCEGKVNETPNY